MKNTKSIRNFVSCLLVALVATTQFATPFAFARANPYSAGETLSPDCGPGEANCTVTVSSGGSSTFANATDSNISSPSSGNILIWDGTDSWDNLALSGDILINNLGVATIQNDSVELGANTSGNFVASITNGLGISGADGGSESAGLTLSLDIDGLTAETIIGDSDALIIYDASAGAIRKITRANLFAGVTGALLYQGTWNASTNTPTLNSSAGTKGNYYVVSVAGSTNLDGISTWAVDNWVIYNGSAWEKLESTNDINSVFGRTGAIAASVGDYTASQITNVAAGDIVATDLQAALDELDSEKQMLDAQLTDIAGLTPNDGDFIVGDGTNFISENGATVRTSLGLGAAGTPTFANLGLSSGAGTSLALTRSASGQWLALTDGTDSFGIYNYAGSPEANIIANTGSLAIDTTSGGLYIKGDDGDATGWTAFGSASGNSLQLAYGTGGAITTTDAKDFDLVLDDTTTDSNFDIDIVDGSTSTVSISRLDGAGTADPNQLLLLENLDADRIISAGLKIAAAAGGLTSALDLTDSDITNAISVAANTILGTTGNIDFTNFDMIGSSGDITTAGDFAINGGDIRTTATTANLWNTIATTLNIGGESTSTVIGAMTGTTTIGSDLVISGNDLTFGNGEGFSNVTDGQIAFSGHLIPTTSTLDIGDASNPIRDLFVSANSINIAGTSLSNASGTLTWAGAGGISSSDSGGSSNIAGALAVAGETALNGNVILGDAATDTLIISGILQGSNALVFEGGTANAFETTFAFVDPTADRTITFPDLSGTLLLSSLVDNISDSFDLAENTNNYFNIDTTNGSEIITFGNATTNPNFNFLGTGDFTINASQKYNTQSISDLASGGSLGSAAATVDVATSFNINQTTAGQTLTLPAPTATTAGRLAFIGNTGTASFEIGGLAIASNQSASFIWNGSAWAAQVASASGLPLSALVAATGANSIDNDNFAQIWSWDTATSQNPITFDSTSLVAGNLFTLNSTNTGHIGNSLLLADASTGAATNGLARFNFSGAHTGNGFQIDDATLTGTAVQINANALTDGNALAITATPTGTGSLLDLTRTAAGRWFSFADGTDSFGIYNSAGTPETNIAANIGSLAIDTTNGSLFVKTTDSANTGWEKTITPILPDNTSSALSFGAAGAADILKFDTTDGAEVINISKSIIPSNTTVDIGDASNPIRDLYVSNASIHVGTNTLTNATGVLTWDGAGGISSSDSGGSSNIAGALAVAGDSALSGNVILGNDISDTLTITAATTFADGSFLDLASILYDDTALQGLRLPQAASFTNPTSGEGFLAWDSDDDKMQVYDGSTWSDLGAATLQDSYEKDVDGSDATIELSSDDDSIIIQNPASGTDSTFAFKVDQDDTTNNQIAIQVDNAGTGNALFLNQDGDGVALNIDSEATTATNAAINIDRAASGLWLNFADGTDSFGIYNSAGTPETNIAANIGSLAIDTTNGKLYIKSTDSANTGWGDFLSAALVDNVSDALNIREGTNNYFNIDTTDTSEIMAFGNTTTNPTFSFLGDGKVGIGQSTPGAKLEVEVADAKDMIALLIDQDDTTNNNIALQIENAGTGNALFLNQDGEGVALNIDSEATTANIASIDGATLTTGTALNLTTLDALTTGSALRITSDSANTGTRNLVSIINDNVGSSGTTALRIQQDSTGDILNLFDGANEVFTVLNGGNVGIGTAGPGAKLEIIGDSSVADATLPSLLHLRSTENYDASPITGINFGTEYKADGSSAGMGGIGVGKENTTDGDYSSYLTLYSRANGGVVAEQLRINSSGNVGIGTTDPFTNLHVNGSVVIPTDSKYYYTTNTTAVDTNWSRGYVSSPAGAQIVTTGAVVDKVFKSANYGYLLKNNSNESLFEVSGDGGNSYFKGNMGIGSSGNSEKLNVSQSGTSDATVATFKAAKNNGGSGTAVLISDDRGFSGNNSGTTLKVISRIDASNSSGALVAFQTNDGTTTKDRLWIGAENGYIGIGSDSPNAGLQIGGTDCSHATGSNSFCMGDSGSRAEIWTMHVNTIVADEDANSDTLIDFGENTIDFQVSNTRATLLSNPTAGPNTYLTLAFQDGGFCDSTNEVLETDASGRIRCGAEDSDERLKNVVSRDVLYGLDVVNDMEFIQFTWNELANHSMDDGINAYQGFSAQNLLEVAPELVFTGSQGYYGIDKTGLIATAWKAIQELNTKVDENIQPNGLVINNAFASSGLAFINVDEDGNVGLGVADPNYKLDVDGWVNSSQGYKTAGADYAEYFATTDSDLAPGEAVCVDLANSNSVKRCDRVADGNLMGVVSSDPAFVGNNSGNKANNPNFVIVGMLGQVPARVNSENGEIRVGDSLTSSSNSGELMRAGAGDPTVGVALESGSNIIKILISRKNKSFTVAEIEEKVADRVAKMEIEDEVNLLIADAVIDLDLDNKITQIAQAELLKSEEKFILKLDEIDQEIAIIASNLEEAKTKIIELELEQTYIPSGILIDENFIENGLTFATVDELGKIGIGVAIPEYRLHVAGDVGAEAFIQILAGATEIPTELLSENGKGVDLFKLSDFLFNNFKALENEIDQLTFSKNSEIAIGDELKIAGLEVLGEIIFGGDSLGQAKIIAGDAKVKVEFEKEYSNFPIVTIAPNDLIEGDYWISDKKKTGFLIRLSRGQSGNVTFDWHAFGVEGGKIFVSDGTIEEIGNVNNDSIIKTEIVEPIFEEVVEPIIEEVEEEIEEAEEVEEIIIEEVEEVEEIIESIIEEEIIIEEVEEVEEIIEEVEEIIVEEVEEVEEIIESILEEIIIEEVEEIIEEAEEIEEVEEIIEEEIIEEVEEIIEEIIEEEVAEVIEPEIVE